MPGKITVEREASVPDAARVERCRRLPELGPRLLFFSGGTALRAASLAIKKLTHNSVHLMTPFDSGGSSAKLRESFRMLSVGDIRSRLTALADDDLDANPAVYRLFRHRLAQGEERMSLVGELASMIDGRHPLVEAVPRPMRGIVRAHLRRFADQMPSDFDLRGASIGNLLITGGYLEAGRDIDAVIFLFARLLQVRGTVRPTVDVDAHLRARLEDGRFVLGQNRMTGKEAEPVSSPIADLELVDAREPDRVVEPEIDDETIGLLERADLIAYTMGSFWTSLVANLLPRGVGRAIAARTCPKVFVPGTGRDPELLGRSVADCVEEIVRRVRRDAGEELEARRALDLVLLDEDDDCYDRPVEVERIEGSGVRVLRLRLVTQASRLDIDPRRLAEALVSLA